MPDLLPDTAPKKTFPFIWLALIIVAITLASAGTYYVIRSRTPTSTSSGAITDLPKNPFASTPPNPFADTPQNPFAEDDTSYQNPFENLQ